MLNFDKIEVILLGPEHLRDQLSGDVVPVDGIALASNTTVKNLGVILVRDLSFHSHVKQISRTAFFHLHYFKNQADLLKKMQKNWFTRSLLLDWITATPYYQAALLSLLDPSSRSRMLQLVYSLKLRKEITFKIILLTYKALIGDAPSYLEELVVPYCPTRELRSLNAG